MRPGDSTLPDINNYPIVNEAAAVQHLSVSKLTGLRMFVGKIVI